MKKRKYSIVQNWRIEFVYIHSEFIIKQIKQIWIKHEITFPYKFCKVQI